MSIIDSRVSKIKAYERDKDLIVDHVDDAHVRLMKLFPLCNVPTDLPLTDYRRFHARYYIPRDIYHDGHSKVDRLFILMNGLDETSYFTLYDQLGHGLSKHGYACVLLPLPNHLNRNPEFRFNDPQKTERPSDAFLKEKNAVYGAYLQYLDEIKILCDHLRGKCSAESNLDECSFYHDLFKQNLSISLLGYSIGGLAALASFLLQETECNSCVMLNAGAKLEDIDTSYFIPLHKWQQIVKDLHNNWDMKSDASPRAKFFDKVFLGNNTYNFKEELREVSRKILFVLGGADTVTKYDSIRTIEPKQSGLSIMKLPGMNHFLSLDTEWSRWFKMVISMIAQFDENASRDALAYTAILDNLLEYCFEYDMFGDRGEYYVEKISSEDDRLKFNRIIYAAESVFGSMTVAVAAMYLHLDRTRKLKSPPASEKATSIARLFGQRAKTKHNLSDNIIRGVLKDQVDSVSKGEEKTPIGELLVRAGVLSPADRDALLERDVDD